MNIAITHLARIWPLALALWALSTSIPAQETRHPITLPTPDLPASPYPGDAIEPEVTITETEAEVVYEYRIKGKLYMVKIDPLVGAPYYLFDRDGDGELDERDTPGPDLSVPQWLLFRW